MRLSFPYYFGKILYRVGRLLMKDKNRLYLIIGIVVAVLFLAGTFTYAYINRANSSGNTNLLSEIIDSNSTISYTGETTGNMSITVDLNKLQSDTASNDYASFIEGNEASASMTLAYEPTFFKYGLTCDYKISYVPSKTYVPTSASLNAGLKEFVLIGTNGSDSFEADLGNVSSETIVYESKLSPKVINNPYEETWRFSLRFYNLDVNQEDVAGKEMAGSVKIIPGNCRGSNEISNIVLAQADGNDKASSQDDGGIYRVVNQNGYRYQGKNPNNYVEFNNGELWRIIGAFEGSTIGLEEGEYYTKIIKDESIGDYYWDENDENNWVNASLNNYLNGTYLRELDSFSKGMITSATWYLGGVPADSYEIYNTLQFYEAERGSTGGGASPTTLNYRNRIGLIYPSDYGYAMYDGSANTTCTTDSLVYDYHISRLKCANYDWLFYQDYYWTITSVSVSDHYEFRVNEAGYVMWENGFNYAYGVRPTVYLKSNINVESGLGTKEEPYKLELIILDDFTLAVTTDWESEGLSLEKGYKEELLCNDNSVNYNFKYRSIDIPMGAGKIICELIYAKDTAEYPNLREEVQRLNSTDNDGYRYQGKQPNNWVWFNDELWRIIGSVPVCTNATIASGATSGTCNKRTNLVKIIRNESIGGLAYHSSETNTVWGSGNTLYTLLNEKYHGKQNATGASPCYGYSTYLGTCDYRINGISKNKNDYYNKMIESVHMNVGTVRSTSTYIDVAYDLETNLVTKQTAIGLMNVSDYGYAASGITYSSTDLSSLSSSVANNWLYGNGNEWTMTPRSSDRVMRVGNHGNLGSYIANYGRAVRPILYLDSGVYIRGGNGTITNPYILGL